MSELTRDSNERPLCECVQDAVERYFTDMDGHDPEELYKTVLAEMERPLLEVVMEKANGNQSRAAKILGLNRGTLRKKLSIYDLD